MSMSSATILLVDDEEEMTVFVQDALEDAGYTVMAAYSAKQAERMIRKQTPDLIVLDVMMPGTDGFQFCKQVRMRYRVRSSSSAQE